MTDPNHTEDNRELYEAILSLDSLEECEIFFDDLLTYNELESMRQRIRAAKLLLSGHTYEQIIAETNISSATLSRVSKCVRHGNGYRTVLGKNSASPSPREDR